MKAIVLLIAITMILYWVWAMLEQAQRKHVKAAIVRHGPRIGCIITAILLLAAATYYLPATSIL